MVLLNKLFFSVADSYGSWQKGVITMITEKITIDQEQNSNFQHYKSAI